MPKTSHLDLHINSIIDVFASHSSGVFRQKDIAAILRQNAPVWGMSINSGDFIDRMMQKKLLAETVFEFPHRKETIYAWGNVPAYRLIAGISPKGYFSHFTALHLHGLTEQIPKVVYFNIEQTPKPQFDSRDSMSQDSLAKAFQRKARVSANEAKFQDWVVRILNGKATKRLGVVDLPGHSVPVSDLERTLVDCAVRPEYAGGVFSVLDAYRRAVDRLSVTRMAATLKRLDYVYPYHQAIGFYLKRAGYPENLVGIFREIPMTHDFYLTHAMRDPDYVDAWRLFVPKGMA